MPKSLTPRLQDLKGEIEGYARGFGLDFFETVFEVLSTDELNMVASYGGFPTRYPHWRWGMEFEQLSKSWSTDSRKSTNWSSTTTPASRTCSEANAEVDQKLVMAHVYGHNDFFKNNFTFKFTNRKMVDEMANHGTRISPLDRRGRRAGRELHRRRALAREPPEVAVHHTFNETRTRRRLKSSSTSAPREFGSKKVPCGRT